MEKSPVSYSKNLDTLVALVTFLAAKEGRSDAVNAPRLARYLGLDEVEVAKVLDHFKGFFRCSIRPYTSQDYGKQKNYSLLLRYAHRQYHADGSFTPSGPLSNNDLSVLLEFIAEQTREERETERRTKSDRLTLVAASIAAILSFASIMVTFLK